MNLRSHSLCFGATLLGATLVTSGCAATDTTPLSDIAGATLLVRQDAPTTFFLESSQSCVRIADDVTAALNGVALDVFAGSAGCTKTYETPAFRLPASTSDAVRAQLAAALEASLVVRDSSGSATFTVRNLTSATPAITTCAGVTNCCVTGPIGTQPGCLVRAP